MICRERGGDSVESLFYRRRGGAPSSPTFSMGFMLIREGNYAYADYGESPPPLSSCHKVTPKAIDVYAARFALIIALKCTARDIARRRLRRDLRAGDRPLGLSLSAAISTRRSRPTVAVSLPKISG